MNPYCDLHKAAKDDVAAALQLYEAKLYPLAVFHFQQAIEKACKFWGLSKGLITWEEIKNIGHNPDKVFRILFKQISKIEGNIESEYDKMFNDFCKRSDLDERAKKVLSELLHIIENPAIPFVEGRSPYEAVATYFEKDPNAAILHPGLPEKLEELKNHPHRDEVAMNFLYDTENECKMPACLMLLSILAFNTEQNARYPDSAKKIKPEDLYNENTLFVLQIPFLCDMLNRNLEILDYYHIERYKEPRFAKPE